MENGLFFSAINNYSVLFNFLEPYAKKNRISTGAVIFLLAINEEVDLSAVFKAEFKDELIGCGLIEATENSVKITGKGAILAKSLKVAVQKFDL